jgi:hypothetical protein
LSKSFQLRQKLARADNVCGSVYDALAVVCLDHRKTSDSVTLNHHRTAAAKVAAYQPKHLLVLDIVSAAYGESDRIIEGLVLPDNATAPRSRLHAQPGACGRAAVSCSVRDWADLFAT